MKMNLSTTICAAVLAFGCGNSSSTTPGTASASASETLTELNVTWGTAVSLSPALSSGATRVGGKAPAHSYTEPTVVNGTVTEGYSETRPLVISGATSATSGTIFVGPNAEPIGTGIPSAPLSISNGRFTYQVPSRVPITFSITLTAAGKSKTYTAEITQ